MWYLTSSNDPRVLYVLPNKEITIGRSVDAQVCNFAIPDDPSISRKHVTLSVADNNLYLQDLGSRYGTFINDSTEKLEHNTLIKVNKNDIVKFGKMGSIWKVNEINFVTCTSTLKGENLQNLKLSLNKIGAVLKLEWEESCTYLTMPAITLTIKVVLALAQGSHIVTTDYWVHCLEAVNSQKKLPDPTNFTPQVIESTLNQEKVSFEPNHERKTLFNGKTVIFFSRRQLEMYKTVLIKCSATPLLMSDTKMTKSSLCDENVFVIQYNITSTSQETQAQRNQINDIVNYLKSKGKRVVADAEIGLAILFCSTVKYCNPNFNLPLEVVKQSAPTAKATNVLAQETQETANIVKCKTENVEINETLISLSVTSNSKRKMSEETHDSETNANKKFANETTTSTSNNESVKRKYSDDNNENVNPSKKAAIGSDGDDIFNFRNPSKDQNDEKEKKLNFSRPLKRKADANEDDDIFNFVQDKKAAGDPSKNNIFENSSTDEVKKDSETIPKERTEADIAALRGSKLKELMENNSNWTSDNKQLMMNIKKEEPDELDKKMNDLDLGTTVVIVRNDLIVKKEPLEVEDQVIQDKNFKKFKKVWPLKMQVTVIPKSSMSIVIPDGFDEPEISSMSY